MGKTLLNLRQLTGKFLSIGSNAANNNGLLVIEKGTGSTSELGLDVKNSATIGGNLTIVGNLDITGVINESNVTNLQVSDKNITLNKGGTTAAASGGGLDIEGSGSVVGAFRFDASKGNKFTIGDGTTQKEIATVDQLGASSIYFRSVTVTGTQDAANKSYTLSNTVSAGSEQVFLNGILQTPGSTNDYLIAGTAITFQSAADAPAATDVIRVYGVY